ncbi:MAG: single-stranded-DNA-specific exonuclease RecJ [Rhodanobacter sp.]|nr:single-stranded-DNA-specific exonuclease RecJ [Rhodanobacter sp.]
MIESWPAGIHPVLARVLAARGITSADLAHMRLSHLVAPFALGGIERACALLEDALVADRRICVVGDYDADGATGTAVAIRGLRLLGAKSVGYRVPNRLRDGYGLSSALVESLADAPDIILTVDNGIASHAGVAAARARGMRVIVTDHHLPGATLPDADAIVNPNAVVEKCKHGRLLCDSCAHDARLNAAFPSKALAGVGVVFYLLLALRARLYPCDRPDREDQKAVIHDRPSLYPCDHPDREDQKAVIHDRTSLYPCDRPDREDQKAVIHDRTSHKSRPDLSTLLDLVALGTIADLVPLDANNRILVDAGLRRIRAGRCCAGITALFRAAGRDSARAVASDMGFALGPRINAAGRLEDMSLGIECLLCDEPSRADALAARLSAINQERQGLQSAMVEQAQDKVAAFLDRYRADALPLGVVLHESDWHPGVVGLVASRLKEKLHRPVIAFADIQRSESSGTTDALMSGSGRSIQGFHLRDALTDVDVRCPGLIVRFGGHAAAAGLVLRAQDLLRFAEEFDAAVRQRLDPALLEREIWSDGVLDAYDIGLNLANTLRYAAPWGQAFPEPSFDGVFDVQTWRVVGERHLKLRLRIAGGGEAFDAILFDAQEFIPPPSTIRAVYQLDVNRWNGCERVQLLLRHLEAV